MSRYEQQAIVERFYYLGKGVLEKPFAGKISKPRRLDKLLDEMKFPKIYLHGLVLNNN